jgi:hypothetical protein
MAWFHRVPGIERISGQTLSVQGDSLTVGLFGAADDVTITNDGNDLTILPLGTSGNSSLWKIAVRQGARHHLSGLKDRIYAIGGNWVAADSFEVRFDFKPSDSLQLDVRPLTQQIFGGATSIWRGSHTPAINLISNTQELVHQPTPVLEFNQNAPQKAVDFAVFAAKFGHVDRACNLMVIIPHPFAQGRGIAVYGGMGFFTDALSVPLIRYVIDRFALERWGSQVFAASDNYAVLMPVPAGVDHGGEIGPFVSSPGVGTQLIQHLIGLSEGRMAADQVGICCFSGGIHNANSFIAAGGRGLNIRFGCNQDPVVGTPMSAAVPTRRQFLSGYTTGGPRPGFIYLPENPYWLADPSYALQKAALGGEYPHTWAVPNYTLYAALKTA